MKVLRSLIGRPLDLENEKRLSIASFYALLRRGTWVGNPGESFSVPRKREVNY